jgi:hypothetical protein
MASSAEAIAPQAVCANQGGKKRVIRRMSQMPSMKPILTKDLQLWAPGRTSLSARLAKKQGRPGTDLIRPLIATAAGKSSMVPALSSRKRFEFSIILRHECNQRGSGAHVLEAPFYLFSAVNDGIKAIPKIRSVIPRLPCPSRNRTNRRFPSPLL